MLRTQFIRPLMLALCVSLGLPLFAAENTLTPTLTARNAQRASFLRDIRDDAGSKIATHHLTDLYRHRRLSVHPDPAMRAQLRAERRKSYEIGHRYVTLKKRIEALDLSKAADWTVFQGISPHPNGDWWDLTQPLSTAFKRFSTLPVVALSAAEEAEHAFATTRHEINEAFDVEVYGQIGSDLHFLGTTIVSLAQDKVDNLGTLRRRRDAMLALTTFPADPHDPNLWGHDTRLKSLALTPKVGSSIAITPAFSAATLSYSMGYRGNQVHRVDAVAEDSSATVTATKESSRVVVRVESELGDIQNYIVSPNDNAKLSALAAKTNPNTPRALTPAFDADTTAYESPANIPLGALVVTGTAAEPGAVAATRFVPNQATATSIEVEVTAPDETTKKKYVITKASS